MHLEQNTTKNECPLMVLANTTMQVFNGFNWPYLKLIGHMSTVRAHLSPTRELSPFYRVKYLDLILT